MIDRQDNPDFLNEFLDYSIIILNKSPNSIKEYNYDISNFLKFIMSYYKLSEEEDLKNVDISNMKIETIKKITLQDIHAYISFLTNTYHIQATTRARKISSIRIFFKYLCQKTKKIDKNPAQDLETPKIEKRDPKYLTLEDSQKLLDSIINNSNDENKERDFAIITLFLNCGMRLSELVGINISDINFSEEQLNVIGKGNKERTIYLNKASMAAINNYIRVRPREGVKINSRDALFLSKRLERISNRTVQYIVKTELQKAGLDSKKLSTHKLRHTAATLMYQYGNVDIRALQAVLGHESIATTQIYTHVSNEQVRHALEDNPLSDYRIKEQT